MSTPQTVEEKGERGPFLGTGPHNVATGMPAPPLFRVRFVVGVIIKNASTTDVLFSGGCVVVKHSNTGIVVANENEDFAAPGWAGNVAMGVAIIDGEIVGNVLVPDISPDAIEVTFELRGVTT